MLIAGDPLGVGPAPGASTAGLDAQIIRYKKELADCVNCASASTAEGKAAIAAAANKVGAAEARIESMTAPNQNTQPAESSPSTTQEFFAQAYDEATLIYARPTDNESSAATRFSEAASGTRVDVFA